ncbi:MAG TPA: hypothetical protein VFB54_02285 [Burkholderiales bacterium]|nr:hypothetical protein [Burkholderiales bacterium]
MHVDGTDDGVGYAVSATSNMGEGVRAKTASQSAAAVAGFNRDDQGTGPGILGEASGAHAAGVIGRNKNANGKGWGVWGYSENGQGMYGESNSTSASGVAGFNRQPNGTGAGVYGMSENAEGVRGESNSISAAGVAGINLNAGGGGTGVWGESPGGEGVHGESMSDRAPGIAGFNRFDGEQGGGAGVWGASKKGEGVHGETESAQQNGVVGINLGRKGFGDKDWLRSNGVLGISNCFNGTGVSGVCKDYFGTGVLGRGGQFGLHGQCTEANPWHAGCYALNADNSAAGFAGGYLDEGVIYSLDPEAGPGATVPVGIMGRAQDPGYAAVFFGHVRVVGTLTIEGNLEKPTASFKIDHPLDPANKCLYHSVVESSEMKNVYDGVVTLDRKGEAVVVLPEWFEALNGDFRYQLTAVGAASPNLHIAAEIAGGRFKIAGGQPRGKVCWQVTGVRCDPYSIEHRLPVEAEKSPQEKGKALYR